MLDTVSGYTSSIFFSVPKEKIKYYITSNQDAYLDFLKEINILSDELIYTDKK